MLHFRVFSLTPFETFDPTFAVRLPSSVHPSLPNSYPLCFDNHAKPLCRNCLLLIIIQNARGWVPQFFRTHCFDLRTVCETHLLFFQRLRNTLHKLRPPETPQLLCFLPFPHTCKNNGGWHGFVLLKLRPNPRAALGQTCETQVAHHLGQLLLSQLHLRTGAYPALFALK